MKIGSLRRSAPILGLLLLLGSCCSEDSNGNCADGCIKESEQRSCTGGPPPESGTLKISYDSPTAYDSVVIEIHHSAEVETSRPYQVLRPRSGREWSEHVLDGDWSARAVYWKGGSGSEVYDATDISYDKSYGCTCYEHTPGTGSLDLTWE